MGEKSADAFPVDVAAFNACVHYQWGFVSIDYPVIVHYCLVIAALAALVLGQAKYLGFVAACVALVERLPVLFDEMHVGAALGAYV